MVIASWRTNRSHPALQSFAGNILQEFWPYLIFLAVAVVVIVQVLLHRRRIQATGVTDPGRSMGSACDAQALFNSMLEGVLLLDQDGRIQLFNDSFQRLFSCPNTIRGQMLSALAAAELNTLSERVRKELRVPGFEMTLPGSPDRQIDVNAAAVYDEKGEMAGALFVFHDLTRLKQLENTRQEFVANVSHELRTPLSLIKGFVETLLEGAKDDPAVATRFLRNIEKHTNRLTYLIEDLLTISRLESRQVILNVQEVHLAALVEKVFDDLHSRADEKAIRLESTVPADFVARADADRLQQVFFNLIENAIKYGRGEGNVTVGGRERPDDKLELWVKDDGSGIPPEAKDRIFERFYRVDRARSRETGGTGLGLSIVKHIVQAHEGDVWVTSELGKGATFYFTLPKA